MLKTLRMVEVQIVKNQHMFCNEFNFLVIPMIPFLHLKTSRVKQLSLVIRVPV